jgi:macrolide transport system ATP-binding/permease protein
VVKTQIVDRTGRRVSAAYLTAQQAYFLGIYMPFTPVLHARSRAQIVLSRVGITRGATSVLSDVNCVITPASRLAIVGENGRGKSTLLHVLAGTLPATDGEVFRIGTVELAEQEMTTSDRRSVGEVIAASIADSLSALEELDVAGAALAANEPGSADRYATALEQAEALDAWDAERRVQVALDALHAQTDWTRPLSELSVGQRYRVRLACLLGGRADFLLLDEPTNHLDRSALDFLTQQLHERPGGVVLASHDRALLSEITRTTLDLDPTPDGRPRIFGDGYDGYREGRRAMNERWEQEYHQQQERHSQLQQDLSAAQNRLVSGWKPDKGTGKHQRATRAGGIVQSVRRRQEALAANAITVPTPPTTLSFPRLEGGPKSALISAEKVEFSGRLAPPVTLDITGGSHTVISGENGAGKSTLLQILAGTLSPSSGQVSHSRAARVRALWQESDLPLDARVNELYESHVNKLVSRHDMHQNQIVVLSSLGLFHSRDLSKRVGELSMGQRRRLDLAMVLSSRPNVLLLDEPTNHLSISLVDELTQALRATPATVVLSTHDRQLLRDLSDWAQLELHAPPNSKTEQQ